MCLNKRTFTNWRCKIEQKERNIPPNLETFCIDHSRMCTLNRHNVHGPFFTKLEKWEKSLRKKIAYAWRLTRYLGAVQKWSHWSGEGVQPHYGGWRLEEGVKHHQGLMKSFFGILLKHPLIFFRSWYYIYDFKMLHLFQREKNNNQLEIKSKAVIARTKNLAGTLHRHIVCHFQNYEL